MHDKAVRVGNVKLIIASTFSLAIHTANKLTPELTYALKTGLNYSNKNTAQYVEHFSNEKCKFKQTNSSHSSNVR